MAYHISRDGTQLGTFTEEEVIEGLEKGEILGSDELWTEGMDEWQPVHEVIEVDEDEEEEVVEPSSEVEEPIVSQQAPAEPEPDESESEPDDLVMPEEEEEIDVIPPAAEPAVEERRPVDVPVEPVVETQTPSAAPAAKAEVVYRSVGPSLTLGQYGTEGTAIASMVLGILSLISGFITGVPAILCGHMARSRIRRSGGAYSGDGLAVTGLIFGYVTSTLMVIWLALLVGGFPVPLSKSVEGFSKERHATSEGRELVKALKQYAEKHENKFPHALEVLGDEKIVDAERLKQLLAPDLGPSWTGPSGWDYLGSSMPDGNYADRPLLISRAMDAGGHHLVIFQDVSATKAEIQTK